MDPTHVGHYFNIDPTIAHLVPELLADLYELGSFPERIVGLLEPLELSPSARVLDLGSGKGAVALALASELDLRVEGIDLLEAFVQEARVRADRAGLSRRCSFEVGDMRELAEDPGRSHDAALYISVGDVLGPLDQAVGRLRRLVRPDGGLIVIDDAYASALRAFVHKEREECQLLETALGCATWVLERVC